MAPGEQDEVAMFVILFGEREKRQTLHRKPQNEEATAPVERSITN